MNRILVVTGISGAGKDFLIEKVKKNLPAGSIYFGDFGDLMFQLYKDELCVSSRDMLKDLNQKEIYPYIKPCIDYIRTKEPAVISSHSVVKQQGFYTVNYEMERLLYPKTYVFVTTSPESVLKHRQVDKTRNRETQGIEEVKFHNNFLLCITKAYTESFASRLVILENREDNIEENARILYEEILNL
jgi:adenylate kinase